MGVNRYKGTCSSNAALVNKYVGTAYDHVKTVSDNIEDVKTVADALGDDFPEDGLNTIVENIDDVVTVATKIDDVITVSGISTDVTTVAGIEQEIIDVPSYTAQAIDAANAAEEDADRAKEQADLAANIADPYKGLWPDTGGSSDKGDVYQTQVGGVGTGQYFTALQNTTIDPVNDDVNWREVVSTESFAQYTDIVYKASGGDSAVERMLSDLSLNPLMHAVGTIIKTGGTTWEYVDSTGTITTDNFRAFNCANIYDFTSSARSDSEAAIAAVATGLSVYVPKRSTPWNLEFITLNEGQKIKGDKTNVSITGNVTAFIHAKDSQVEGFIITGDGANSGSTNQAGVYGNNVGGTKTKDVDFRAIGGSAYQIDNIVQFHQGNELSSYTVDGCNIGLNINTKAEYQNIGTGSITRCNTNLRIKGGNCNAFGLVISDAVGIGVDIVAGANDAHGQLNGALINHNSGSRTIRVDGTANGFLFNGCQLFNGSPIELTNCHNVWFRNCVKQAVAVIEDGCTKCGFASSDLLDGANTTPNINNPSEVFWLDNNLPDSTAPNGPGGINGGYLSLTQQVNGSSAVGSVDFDWDTVSVNAITNNLSYTVQQFYGDGGAGTSNPFIRGDVRKVRGGFHLQVNSQITLGKPGSPSWSSSECRVLIIDIAGGVIGRFIPTTVSSVGASNIITYQYTGNVLRGAFKVQIENSSLVPLTIYRDQLGTEIRTFMEVTGW